MRTETASGHRRVAFIGAAGGCVRVSQGTVRIQRCRTLPSELATTGFVSRAMTEDQDSYYPIPVGQGKDPQEGKKDKEA